MIRRMVIVSKFVSAGKIQNKNRGSIFQWNVLRRNKPYLVQVCQCCWCRMVWNALDRHWIHLTPLYRLTTFDPFKDTFRFATLNLERGRVYLCRYLSVLMLQATKSSSPCRKVKKKSIIVYGVRISREGWEWNSNWWQVGCFRMWVGL